MADELQALAFKLADSTARADVECLCLHTRDRVFDTAYPPKGGVHCDDAQTVAEALRYIELRGDALPYRVFRNGTLIRFEGNA